MGNMLNKAYIQAFIQPQKKKNKSFLTMFNTALQITD